jgi:hypothetical protein
MSEETETPGWDAIDAALRSIYGQQEPLHFGTLVRFALGGPDPLDGISAYVNLQPLPHWHLISYGLSELYTKSSEDAEMSGFGYEFSMRVARDANEERPPVWAMNLMQNLARLPAVHGSYFDEWHTIDCNGPICLGADTKLTAVAFTLDPQLGKIQTPHGRLKFLQIVGLTGDELSAKNAWNSQKLLELMAESNPLLITDLKRPSMLESAQLGEKIRDGIRRDGSSCDMLHIHELSWKKPMLRKAFTLTIGAGVVESFIQVLPARITHGRAFALMSPEATVEFVASPGGACAIEESALKVALSAAAAEEIASSLRPVRGEYTLKSIPDLVIRVEPSEIRDRDGNIVETIG